jgi:transcriptional regulator with XRE-family HTH domain
MRVEKAKALQLRQQGKSYNQISTILKVPKSTLSSWLKDVQIPKLIKDRMLSRGRKKSVEALIKRNKQQTVEAKFRANKIRKSAAKEVKKLKENDLFLVGISLYWGEGYKRGAEIDRSWKCVDFTNSDPAMVEVAMRFFREICGVPKDKFRVQLMLHENISAQKAIKFWSQLTKIDENQFMKPTFVVSSASKKRRGNTLEHGTVHIRVYDVRLFHRIIGWIDGLKKQAECSSVSARG